MKRISEHRKQELEQYERVKFDVVMRDHLTCQRCWHLKNRLRFAEDVAHILPRSRFGKDLERKHAMKNLICLCRTCHKATENPEGRTELLKLLHFLHGYDYSEPPWNEYV